MNAEDFIYCSRCGLKQFGRPRCLRCGVNLAQPDLPALLKGLRGEMRAEFAALRNQLEHPQIPSLNDSPGPLGVQLVPGAIFPDPLPTLAEAEESLIRIAMLHAGGDRLKAAKLLGIGKTTMYRKVKELGL